MRFPLPRPALVSAFCFCALAAWDASGLDLVLARAAGAGPQGFALRDERVLVHLLHDGGKAVAWAAWLLCCVWAVRPAGPLARLSGGRRLQLVATPLACAAVVALVKGSSRTSCPWDLQAFGGAAEWLSHWAGWAQSDGGPGGCFPAGHAASGFAFVGGFFALRNDAARAARLWLAAALAAGLVLGIGQQLRGAHFMSHTLWSAWLCWMTAWLSDPLFAASRTEPAMEALK